MSENRFNFDSKFLKAALLRLISEPYLIDKFRDLMYPELFDMEDEYGALKRIAKVVLEKSKETEVSVEGVWAWIQLLPGGVERNATISLFSEMRLDEDLWKFARSDQVFETFLQYLKATTFLNSHKKVKDAFNRADFENAYNQFEKTLTQIKNVNMEEDQTIDWDNTKKMLAAISDTSYNTFQLGIDDFDKSAGFEPQSFNLFIGASGGGKSQMSVHLAVQAIKQGKKAYCVFVEDKMPTIFKRLYSCYTGIDQNLLKSYHDIPPEFRARIDEATEAFRKYLKIDFIYGKSHKYVLDKAKTLNDQMKIDGKPQFEVLILDYVGHIAHLAAGDSVHEKLHRACSDLKDFALQTGMIVFTHFQSNRAGAAKSQDGTGLIDMSTIAGSFNSAFVADNIISINRSEEMKAENKCILYVVKGREGAADRKYEVPTEFHRARYDMKEAKLLNGRENY